jgi:D-arginine dehydrogenase
MPEIHRHDLAIVGTGFAAAAMAFHLSRDFDGKIVLLEQEKTPGAHASGRNASLLLQSVADPHVRRTAAASQRAYAEVRDAVGFEEVGSVLLGDEERIEAVRETDVVPSRRLDPEEFRRRIPLLEGHAFDAAVETPGDGVVDTWALLNHYLDGAKERGVEVVLDAAVTAIEADPTYRLHTRRGVFEAPRMVNAAGAWAEDVARLVGVEPPSLVPLKRHLFILDGVEPIDTAWPFVWNIQNHFYFRPESGGLLFSICDEERQANLVETVSPDVEETLAEKAPRFLPRFEDAEVRRVWSCYRTFSDDGRFVVGWDVERDGFFWVAGLGGHGLGCSWEVGRLAAAVFLGREEPGSYDPARFAAIPA